MNEKTNDLALPGTEQYNLLGKLVIRYKGGLSLNQIAENTGISPVALGRILRAKPLRTVPNAAVLEGLAGALSLDLAEVRRWAVEAALLTGTEVTARYVIEGCDNSHDWRQPLGAEAVLVNGQRREVLKVCRACLVQEDSPQAEQPCSSCEQPDLMLPADPAGLGDYERRILAAAGSVSERFRPLVLHTVESLCNGLNENE